MKICFIGLGSIGSRHLKNLTQILSEKNIEFNIDTLRSKKSALPLELAAFINREVYFIEELANDYDVTFITNPTSLHYETIKKLANKTKHMFIEKPVFEASKYDLSDLSMNSEGVYYVACPLRYSPIIKYLKDNVDQMRIYSVRAISSSYLPDWRKGVDYRKVYSAKKSQGGGVTLDLIHEWDYLTYLFGMPLEVHNFSGTYSRLELDSDDISIYIARYIDKFVEVHLDYFGRETVRKIELYCEDYVIYADFLTMKIEYRGTLQKTIQLKNEDIYQNEMNYFIDMILNKKQNINDIYHANKVLQLVTESE